MIDSDYSSAENEGHIFISIVNDGREPIKLKQGDDIVQAVFLPYGVADDAEVTEERTGGIGSTGE